VIVDLGGDMRSAEGLSIGVVINALGWRVTINNGKRVMLLSCVE